MQPGLNTEEERVVVGQWKEHISELPTSSAFLAETELEDDGGSPSISLSYVQTLDSTSDLFPVDVGLPLGCALFPTGGSRLCS